MFLFFLVSNVVVPLVVTIKGVIGQRMGLNLLIVLMGVVHPIWPNKIWCNSSKHITMLPLSWISPNAHLLKSKARGFKITQRWMCRSWTTLWPSFIVMNKKLLLGLKVTHSWSGIGSKLICWLMLWTPHWQTTGIHTTTCPWCKSCINMV